MVMVYNDGGRDAEYFNSFRMRPPNGVYPYIEKIRKGIEHNSSMLQDTNSVLCGYYCLYLSFIGDKDALCKIFLSISPSAVVGK